MRSLTVQTLIDGHHFIDCLLQPKALRPDGQTPEWLCLAQLRVLIGIGAGMTHIAKHLPRGTKPPREVFAGFMDLQEALPDFDRSKVKVFTFTDRWFECHDAKQGIDGSEVERDGVFPEDSVQTNDAKYRIRCERNGAESTFFLQSVRRELKPAFHSDAPGNVAARFKAQRMGALFAHAAQRPENFGAVTDRLRKSREQDIAAGKKDGRGKVRLPYTAKELLSETCKMVALHESERTLYDHSTVDLCCFGSEGFSNFIDD